MKVEFLDLETTLNNKGDDAIGKMQASPYHPDNHIVYTGRMLDEDYPSVNILEYPTMPTPRGGLLVAQNIAFDLSFLLKGPSASHWIKWIGAGGRIWDTMIVEYLLTGQQVKWASLDHLATKYGGTLKDNRIKDYWNQGICTSQIPKNEILPYLEEDVRNLKLIYEGQLEQAKALNMLPLIESQMDARLATILMEVNGMQFDVKMAREEANKLRIVMESIEMSLQYAMARAYPQALTRHEWKPTSNHHISAFLFGGKLEVVRKEKLTDENGKDVVYKSGKNKGEPRYKNVKVEFKFPGIYKSPNPPGRSGVFPVGDKVLRDLGESEFINQLLKLREYKKQISTYFDGYAALVWPDGKIHGSLNHCQTNTGRLSSSSPNLQNVSGKESSDE